MQELEPRILFAAEGGLAPLTQNDLPDASQELRRLASLSGSASSAEAPASPSVLAAAAPANASLVADELLRQLATEAATDSPLSEPTGRELVFIDASVKDLGLLRSAIGARAEVLVLDAGSDGLSQISDFLEGRSGYSAIHLISEGDSGRVQLGSSWLDSDSLEARREELASLGAALAPGGDLLLYGCRVASGEQGASFVSGLSKLTHADVAASTNYTGDAAQGGDWTLEVQAGSVEARSILDAVSAAGYRQILNTYVVTSAADGGAGSLREALVSANTNPGADTVSFNIGGGGAVSIVLSSGLPTITDQIELDASTQGGFAGTPLVQLVGGSAGFSSDGLSLGAGASGSLIKGLLITGFGGSGIVANGVDNLSIQGNYIGLDANGAAAAGNYRGIYLLNVNDSSIGGGSPLERNVVSGNATDGVLLEGTSSRNVIHGNYIGTDASGSTQVGNGTAGVNIYAGGSDNQLGGATAADRNIISGNVQNGVYVYGAAALVQGNYIGVNAAGDARIANGWQGVLTQGNAGGSRILGNVISGNGISGIYDQVGGLTVQGNRIGTNATGSAAIGNVFDGITVEGNGDLIGGSGAGEGNLISGNLGQGVQIMPGFHSSILQSNQIGVDISGMLALGNLQHGVFIKGDDNRVLDNTISGNHYSGLQLAIGGGNRLEGNLIGLNANGTAAVANSDEGILIDGSDNNLIGGLTAGSGNIISGNLGSGIRLSGSSSGNLIRGNSIGSNAAGTLPIPNGGDGIEISASGANSIGGTTAVERNLISGNQGQGIRANAGAGALLIAGNFIGLDASGNAALGNLGNGVLLQAAGVSVSGNVISGNALDGIRLQGAGSHEVEGNLIGTRADGSAALGNGGNGILIQNSDGNLIGGTSAAAKNLIAGNQSNGIAIVGTSTGNQVQGNDIGVRAVGSLVMANLMNGIYLASSGNTVGGSSAGARNVISGNGQRGLLLQSADGNLIQGNAIGTDAAGTALLGNGLDGIQLLAGSSNNTIGGSAAGEGNRIAHNGSAGVSILAGNGNSVLGNLIQGNQGLGIDLGGDGVTSNDVDDLDAGPNQLLNMPVLDLVVSDSLSSFVQGRLQGLASASFRIEVYANASADPSGHGQGAVCLGAFAVTTNAQGEASFSASLSGLLADRQWISATATHLASGSTSEFSLAIQARPTTHAPSGTDNRIAVDEDQALVLDASYFGYTDALDAPLNSLAAIRIVALSGGSFTLNGAALRAGDTVSVAELNAGLLLFTPSADQHGLAYASLSFQIVDDGGTLNGGADTDPTPNSLVIDVNPVNDAPRLVLLPAVAIYGQTGGAQPVAPQLLLSDVDSSSLVSATVRIGSGFVSGHDVLSFVADPARTGNITGHFDASLGVLSLSSASASASLAEWQWALRSVSYSNLSQRPNLETRALRFGVNDGVADSPPAELLLQVEAYRDLTEALPPLEKPAPAPAPTPAPAPAPSPAALPAAPASPDLPRTVDAVPAAVRAPLAEAVRFLSTASGSVNVQEERSGAPAIVLSSERSTPASIRHAENLGLVTTAFQAFADAAASLWPANSEAGAQRSPRLASSSAVSGTEDGGRRRQGDLVLGENRPARVAAGTATAVISFAAAWGSLRLTAVAASMMAVRPMWQHIDMIPMLPDDDDRLPADPWLPSQQAQDHEQEVDEAAAHHLLDAARRAAPGA